MNISNSTSNHLQEYKCRNCGAPHKLSDLFDMVECYYCGSFFFWQDRNPTVPEYPALSGTVSFDYDPEKILTKWETIFR
jgi:DNA-directed RNA polymerase subunit RPC12/RpoP